LWAKALGYPRLMEGPMVGAVGPGEVRIWGRASGPYALSVQYSTDREFAAPVATAPVQTTLASDFTGVVTITGLQPDTRYYYRVLVDGEVDRYRPTPYAVRTAPAKDAAFRVAFGSCARYARDPVQRIFDAVVRHSPDLFFWLGDNVYADAESPVAIADEYRRQRNVQRLQPLIQNVPQLAIWDDHDYGYNNGDGTSPFKAESLAVFRNYWANPAYGLPDTPGVFFQYSYGGVDFFFLDGRYHRAPNTAPDGPEKAFLGARQRLWLESALLASRAPFKVLACGSGWSMADGVNGDTWAAFRTERDALFDFIRDRGIEGVVLLSGDSHVGELNCIPWSERGGYDLYDLVSSPLAQGTSDSWAGQQPELRIRKVYSATANFGLLDFTPGPEPRLHFNLYDESGNAVWRPLVLTSRELRNGVSTWRSKITDPVPPRFSPTAPA
jgi:alkaline phosphatase D